MKTNLNPPALYKLFILIMIIIVFLPLSRVILYPYNLSGLILLFSGTYMALHVKKIFKKTETPMSPSAKPLKLHMNGLFKYSRNPMYLGIVIGLFGIAVLTGSLWNFIFPATYLMIMNNAFVKLEEGKLEKEFGDEYRLYTEQTRRWI